MGVFFVVWFHVTTRRTGRTCEGVETPEYAFAEAGANVVDIRVLERREKGWGEGARDKRRGGGDFEREAECCDVLVIFGDG